MTDSKDQRASERARAEAALRRSSNLMVRQHRALGLPIVVARDKRVVHLDPNTMEEIPPDEVQAFVARAQASWDE